MNNVKRRFTASDGYILLYVMVVVVTLCILAAAICTSAVRNLNVQQHSVEHMKFVYEAEGVGERFVSELQRAVRFEEDGTTEKTYSVVVTEGGLADQKHRDAVKAIFETGYEDGPDHIGGAVQIAKSNAMADPELKGDSFTLGEVTVGNYDQTTGEVKGEIAFRIVSGNSSLDSEIGVTMIVEKKDIPANPSGSEPAKCEYKIGKISFTYLSYVIGSADPTEEGGVAE